MPNIFDEVINRHNTNSLKFDFTAERNKPSDVLPLWVADMDFKVPPAVTRALIEKCEHGIFGYSDIKEDYITILKNWFNKHYNWSIDASWLIKTPGVVYALCTAIRGLTEVGDAVLIQEPVYYPFGKSITNNDRVLINNPLVYTEGKYTIDFVDFEEKIIAHKVKLFILCNPHNPVGRVWTKEELLHLGEICVKHGVIVVSDEIHADFIYAGHTHLVFANLKPEFAEITITCTAPSKTFNLAGLQIANILITNPALKRLFKQEMSKTGYDEVNIMSIVACQAAYAEGEEWLEALNDYLTSNLDLVRTFLEERLPAVKLVEPEGTYLLWLDFNELGLSDEALNDLILNKAKLWLNPGSIFGQNGSGFQRVNIACPRETLQTALLRLEEAINS